MRFAIFSVFAVLAATTAAQAGPHPREADAFRCLPGSQYSVVRGSTFESGIRALQKLHNKADMLRICNDALGNHHYFLRDVRREAGVCRLTELEIFPVYGNEAAPGAAPHMVITGWTSTPAAEWSSKGYATHAATFEASASGTCPPADSDEYRRVEAPNRDP